MDVASEFGDSDLVEFILAQKAQPLVTRFWGYTPLHLAAKKGHIEVVNLLIQEQINAGWKRGFLGTSNSLDRIGQTPIFLAASRGHTEIVEKLVEQTSNPNARNQNGQSPVYIATMNGFTEIVRILARSCNKNPGHLGANAPDSYGQSPILIAATNGHSEILQILVQYTNSPNDPTQANGWTAMHAAAKNGNFEAVEILVHSLKRIDGFYAKYYMNVKDVNGFTPILLAAMFGHTNIVKLLAENTENPNVGDNSGETPILCATKGGFYEIVQILAYQSKTPNAPNIYGQTPIHYASAFGQVEILKILLRYTKSPNTPEYSGTTPMHLAAFHGHTEIVQLLIQHFKWRKAFGEDTENPNPWDNNKNTPIHYAALNGYLEIVQLLAEYIYAPLCMNCNGLTPIHLASKFGHHKIVSILLMHSVSPNMIDSYGWTAMHYAAYNGHIEVVKILSNFMINSVYDYNINSVSYVEGWTPLHIACDQGYYDIVKFLLPIVQNYTKFPTNIDENPNDTPFERAIHNKHQCIANYILQENSDDNTLNNAVKNEDIKISDISFEEIFQFADQLQRQQQFACVANSYLQYVNVFYDNGAYDVIHFADCDCAQFCQIQKKVDEIYTAFGFLYVPYIPQKPIKRRLSIFRTIHKTP